jgi:hypothetical protein
MKNIFPKLKKDVRLRLVDSRYFLLYGEEKLEVNNTGYEIIKILNGTNSMNDIKDILTLKYDEDLKKISQWVDEFLFELWKKNIYLEDNIEIDFSNIYLRSGKYTIIRKNSDYNNLTVNYCSSIIKQESINKTPALSVIGYDTNESISEAYTLGYLDNQGFQLFQLLAMYGDANLDKLKSIEVKNSIINYQKIIQSEGRDKDYNIEVILLDTVNNERNHLTNGKKNICRLKSEIGNNDLIISSIFL